MFDKIFKKFFGKNGEEEPHVKRKGGTIKSKIENHTSAAALAEAGLHDDARETVSGRDSEQGKVVVATYGDKFSDVVIDYAVGFAERLGLEIIAGNIEPINVEYTRPLGNYADKLLEKFEHRAKEEVKKFCEKAEEKKVPFKHLVKYGDLDGCIREVYESEQQVEFVITDPKAMHETNGKTIPVFCLTQET